MGHRLRTECPWLVPPSMHMPPSLTNPCASQLRWATAWWQSHRDCYMPLTPLTLAFRRHVGLAVFHPHQTCGSAPLRIGTPCGVPLDLFSSHVHSCAQGPSLHRHHSIVHCWHNLLQAAGYHVRLEQEVLLHDQGTRRADLVARSTTGEQLAFDVLLTGNPDLRQPIEGHLQRQAAQKASRYERTLASSSRETFGSFPWLMQVGFPSSNQERLASLSEQPIWLLLPQHLLTSWPGAPISPR